MLKELLHLLLLFFVIPTTQASDILKSIPVSPDAVVQYQYHDDTANATSQIPSDLYGEYKLCKEVTNFPEYASTFAINSDGTGFYENWGRNKPKQTFEWGVLVEDGALAVTEYAVDRDHRYPAYVVVYKWSDGTYSSTFLLDVKGEPAFPGPHNSAMKKNEC